MARAPIDEIEVVREQMGWHFLWVSSFGNDFNYDFHVSFTPADRKSGRAMYNFREGDPGVEALSGNSVFYCDEAGDIFMTYGTFGRGGEQFLGIYSFFDIVTKGREENGPTHSLVDWARPRNRYGRRGSVAPTGGFSEDEVSKDSCHG